MSRHSANELNEYLRARIPTETEAVISDARAALRSAEDDYERLAIAGVLVDAGYASRNVQACMRGLAIIRRLSRADPTDAGKRYMLGTAFSAVARLDSTPKPMWFETTRKLQIDQRRELWVAASSSSLNNEDRAQAWINLGNSLDESGRWIEAFAAYLEALRIRPGHPIAAGWAAVILHRRSGTYGSPNTVPLAHYYARIAKADLGTVAHIAPGADKYFADLPTDRADEALLPESAGLDGFEAFIFQNHLHLSMSLDAAHPDCWDSLTTPSISESVSAPSSPPALIAMFNSLKADFLLARELAWSARIESEDDAHHYTDTLDYGLYGSRSSREILAMRAAFDLLDRVAVAANHYFGIGVAAKDAYFKTLWRESIPGSPLKAAVNEEINANNWGLLALVCLSDDFRDDGWLFGQQKYRNIATHRILVAHSHLGGVWRETEEIEHVSIDELTDITVAGLRIARAALIYFSDAISRREARKPTGTVALPIQLPRLGN